MRDLRFYTAQALQIAQELVLEGETHHHLSRVLRLKVGERLWLFNGDGCDYQAQIQSISKKCTIVSILQQEALPQREAPVFTRLYLSLLKGEAFERSLQKAVELGVNELVPLQTLRSERRYDAAREEKKMAHWQGIVVASAMQCGRARLPQLLPLHTFDDLLKDNNDLKIILSPHHACEALPESASTIALAIGPEGGFHEREMEQARASGWLGQSMGPRILRADTATITALSLVQHRYGDLSCF